VRRFFAPLSSTCRTTAALAARGSPSWTTITRSQLDDDYKVWAAYQRAQLKKEKLWTAAVSHRPASGSDDKKSNPVVEA